jgi:hypothetical protein
MNFRFIREYFENTFQSFGKYERKLNQKDTNNIIRMVTSHEIEAGRNNFPKEES